MSEDSAPDVQSDLTDDEITMALDPTAELPDDEPTDAPSAEDQPTEDDTDTAGKARYWEQQAKQEKGNYRRTQAALKERETELAALNAELSQSQGDRGRLERIESELQAIRDGGNAEDPGFDEMVDPEAHKRLAAIERAVKDSLSETRAELKKTRDELAGVQSAREADALEATARQRFARVVRDCEKKFGREFHTKAVIAGKKSLVTELAEDGIAPTDLTNDQYVRLVSTHIKAAFAELAAEKAAKPTKNDDGSGVRPEATGGGLDALFDDKPTGKTMEERGAEMIRSESIP